MGGRDGRGTCCSRKAWGVPNSGGTAPALPWDSALPAEVDSPGPALPGPGWSSGHREPRHQNSSTPAPRPGEELCLPWKADLLCNSPYCCQEPKNTFINGKTGMALHRTILTSPEEPGGRFGAYPQEARRFYFVGSCWGVRAACLSQQGACPVSSPGCFLGQVVLRQRSATWAGPEPALDTAPQDLVAFFPITALSKCSPLWPVSSAGKWRLGAASRHRSGPHVPPNACRVGESPTCSSSRPEGSGKGSSLQVHPQSPSPSNVSQVLF